MQKTSLSASEISEYCRCPRAWYLKRQGYEPENIEVLNAGTRYHENIGRKTSLISKLRQILVAMLILCLLALTVYLLIQQHV